jgi:hypothetical protein
MAFRAKLTDLLATHRRKTKWTCACGWDGRVVGLAFTAGEHEGHLADELLPEFVKAGRLEDILRNLWEFERGRSGTLRDPRYVLEMRATPERASNDRGRGPFGATVKAVYFDDRGEVPVADLIWNGYRWTVVPKKKAEHGEVLKLQQRIGTDVWEEPQP